MTIRYIPNPALKNTLIKRGDKFIYENGADRRNYILVYVDKLVLINTDTGTYWRVIYNPNILELSLTQFLITIHEDYKSGFHYVTPDEELISLVIEQKNIPEYTHIANFVYSKAEQCGYFTHNQPEWRKIGVTEEDENYIIGYDFDKEDMRKFRKDRILEGKIIVEQNE